MGSSPILGTTFRRPLREVVTITILFFFFFLSFLLLFFSPRFLSRLPSLPSARVVRAPDRPSMRIITLSGERDDGERCTLFRLFKDFINARGSFNKVIPLPPSSSPPRGKTLRKFFGVRSSDRNPSPPPPPSPPRGKTLRSSPDRNSSLLLPPPLP